MSTPSPARLDLKCGKGSVSRGEKCHKGAATTAAQVALGVAAGAAITALALRKRAPRGPAPSAEPPLRGPSKPKPTTPKGKAPEGPAPKSPRISIPESASRAITERTNPERVRVAAENFISWQTAPGSKDAMSTKEAEAIIRKKGRILDIHSIPGLDANKAANDIVRGRESDEVLRVRSAYKQFYRDAVDTLSEVHLDGPSTEYYRTHPEARRKKVAKQAEINRRPDERRRRAALSRERRKRGIDGKGGPDVSHTTSGRTVLEDPSTNRGRNGHGSRPRLKRDSVWAQGFTP